jgi:hypothetical protein
MIALITPTGARAKQIRLCTEFMRKQDYEGDVLWIVIDDALPYTTTKVSVSKDNWNVVKIYPTEKWVVGKNTQAQNLRAGIDELKRHAPVEAIFIIEDDDYYPSRYLRVMMEKLEGYAIAGEIPTVYYNVVRRAWRYMKNYKHSSLFQTAFRPVLLPLFEKACSIRGLKFIDLNFFLDVSKEKKYKINLFSGENLAIGIKGQPGRGGIGVGHDMHLRLQPDPDWSQLKKFIGNDYMFYYEPTNIYNGS